MGGIGELFSPKKLRAPETVRMPDPEDPAALEAKRRKASTATGTGRASTVLGDVSGDAAGMAGGSTYGGTLLGG